MSKQWSGEMVDVPEYNESIMCPNCGEKSQVYTDMHGLLGGGGPGRYTVCADCGTVVSKTCDSHKDDNIIDAEFTEVDPNAQVTENKG